MGVARILARRLFDGESLGGPAVVTVDEDSGTIVSVDSGPAASERTGARSTEVHLLSPGFIDLQVNGWADLDVADCSDEVISRLDDALASTGTTSYLPTLTTARHDLLEHRISALDGCLRRRERRNDDGRGSGAVGIHLEGPLLGSRHGAHPGDHVIGADLLGDHVIGADLLGDHVIGSDLLGTRVPGGDAVAEWIDALPATVSMMTVGCESPHAPALVSALVRRGVVVALGHTAPSEQQFRAAVDAGASVVTHLWNAMSGVHHREDGLAAMALTTDSLAATLIADGVHVGRRAAAIAFRTKAPGTVALVSDSVAWSSRRCLDAGATVGPDGGVRLTDGTLAGATRPVADGVRRLILEWGHDPAVALRAATSTPARILGAGDRGRVAVGLRADLVGLDEGLVPRRVWVGGRPAET